MNTAEKRVVDADAAHPSTSAVVVPLFADRPAVEEWPPPCPKPGFPHRLFYGLGYAGLGLLVLGAVMSARNFDTMYALFVMGGMCIGLGGLGVLVHLALRPRTQHKLRTTLGAIASLVLTLAAIWPIMQVSREVHAEALVPAAQAVVDRGKPPTMEEMRRAGMAGADFYPEYVLVWPEGTMEWQLLYARPGHPPPPSSVQVAGRGSWRTEPLGGGWYILD